MNKAEIAAIKAPFHEKMEEQFWVLNDLLVKKAEASKYPTEPLLQSFWVEAFDVFKTNIDDFIEMVEDTWGAEDHEEIEDDDD